MLVGHKTDLRHSLPEAAGVHTAHRQQLAMVGRSTSGPPKGSRDPTDPPPCSPQAHGSPFCETSAKDSTNMVEAVLHLAQ